MGWLFGNDWNKRQDVVDEILGQCDHKAHCLRGNVLWVVATTRGENPRNVILCCLLQRDGQRWGYKDMDESMHPFYYTCPLRYLEMAPVAREDWREKVQYYHESRMQRASRRRVIHAFSV